MRRFNRKSPPIILVVLLCVILSVTQVSAGVNDNVVTAKLESTVGAYEDSKEAHTVFGLLHYLVYQIDQLRSDLANVQIAVSQIQLSSSVSNAMTEQTLYSQFVSSGKTRIEDWSSNVNLQEALATSSIMINSENSNYSLDWYIRNKTDVSDYFRKLTGYSYDMPSMTIVDVVNNKDALYALRDAVWLTTLQKSSELRTALCNSSLKTVKAVYTATPQNLECGIILRVNRYKVNHSSDSSDCSGAYSPGVIAYIGNNPLTVVSLWDGMHYWDLPTPTIDTCVRYDRVTFQTESCSYGDLNCNVTFTYIPLN